MSGRAMRGWPAGLPLGLGLLAVALGACQAPTGAALGGRPGFDAIETRAAGYLPVLPYDPFAHYAPVLDECTYHRAPDPCPLLRLPVIGQETSEPTVDVVMGRVLASHPWMGDRFRQVLEALPREDLRLFRPVTAVVIAGDIRPSFYTRTTGAIYLDAGILWITPEERATVSTAADFRAGYGSDLRFRVLARYVKANGYATAARDLQGTTYRVADVLYHELAHANDYLPPDRLPGLSPYAIFGDVVGYTGRVQNDLYARHPLGSLLLFHLAAVRFHGRPASAADLTHLPERIGGEFAADGANALYSYSTRAEDVAMLFEELMMAYRFGIERDLAVTDVPAQPNPGAEDYTVSWGQRGRLGDPLVRVRARAIAQRLLPELPLTAFLDRLPPPLQMAAGLSWLDNLALRTTGVLAPLSEEQWRAARSAGRPVEELTAH